jgi:hypothetical protein
MDRAYPGVGAEETGVADLPRPALDEVGPA